MFSKTQIFLLPIIFLTACLTNTPSNPAVPNNIQDSSSPISSTKLPPHQISFQNTNYLYDFQVVTDVSKLDLVSNHTRQLKTAEIFKSTNCQLLVNGSFYNTDNQPIGLFTSEGQKLSPSQPNQLFNGFLSADQTPTITQTPPKQARFAIQTGPILVSRSLPTKLSIRNDQPRRRLIAAITEKNQLVFIVVTAADTAFSGPLLEDLPPILTQIARHASLTLTTAINLDGGTASAFYNDTTSLPELKPIGSYFCLNTTNES